MHAVESNVTNFVREMGGLLEAAEIRRKLNGRTGETPRNMRDENIDALRDHRSPNSRKTGKQSSRRTSRKPMITIDLGRQR